MRTAVATFGFGRPEYFSRMLKSLGQCPEIINQTVDLYHYLDGGNGSMQNSLEELIKSSGIPYSGIISRSENFGVGRQLIGARRELLDEQNYDRIILVEDDIEVSESYFSTLLRLSDWSEQFEDTGTVQVWNVESGDKHQFQSKLEDVVLTNRHFVSYCLSKRVWDQIKSILYDYEGRYLLKKKYSRRPHYRIRWFISKLINKSPKQHTGTTINPPTEAVSHPFPKLKWRTSPTSQDAITSIALHVAGLHRLTTFVPRAFYFGENGVHCTPEVYREMGFTEQGFWQWDIDDVPENFTMRYKDENDEWLHSFYR
jgi:hypothetical protein